MAKLYQPNGTVTEVHPTNGKKFTLEELQGYVGGYIELIYTNRSRQMFINEDGKIEGLPHNSKATLLCNMKLGPWDYIVGPAIVLEKSEEDDD